jgi:hypothetical protein
VESILVPVVTALAGLVGVIVGAVLPIILSWRHERRQDLESLLRASRLIQEDLLRGQRRLENALKDGQMTEETLPLPSKSWAEKKEVLALRLGSDAWTSVSEACVAFEQVYSTGLRWLGPERVSDPFDSGDEDRLAKVIRQSEIAQTKLDAFSGEVSADIRALGRRG